MWLAVLSGKGGTGKTTVAALLAKAWPDAQYVDCDVEEPNGYIFLKPEMAGSQEVLCPVPAVHPEICTLCGICGQTCEFNAIACLQDRLMFFPEICHHCGACVLACPENALYEVERAIGTISWNQDRTFIQGILTVGEPIGVPIIRELKRRVDPARPAVFDCSPGASCGVVQSLQDVDLALLVTEPTPFGLHDLKIAVNLVRSLRVPCQVVINKSTEYSRIIHRYCREQDVPVLMVIPFDMEIAKHYSKGDLPWEYGEKLYQLIRSQSDGSGKGENANRHQW